MTGAEGENRALERGCCTEVAVISMKQLLEAGVHFGHQTRRWNPKMARYIYTERNGIYIIDLQETVRKLEEAYRFVKETVQNGGTILFVGTKKQAQETVREEAERCGMFYVNQRWLGGTLTNFQTIKGRLRRLAELDEMESSGALDRLPKKEGLQLRKEKQKLERFLSGIRHMQSLPSAVFVIDPRKEKIAVSEARKLGIKVVAIVDTNCDPDEVDYVIPGNDDAIRAVRLITHKIADAVIEAREGQQGPAAEAAEGAQRPAAGEAVPAGDGAAATATAAPAAAEEPAAADEQESDEWEGPGDAARQPARVRGAR